MASNALDSSDVFRTPPILPLIVDESAKIKSSTEIKDLTDVLIGLLKNSLDAKAAKIDISVDVFRGDCEVEDDGFGIAAAEFNSDGGLAKPCRTSKSQDAETYGRNGTFLSSLSTVSFLMISSRQVPQNFIRTVVYQYSNQRVRSSAALSGRELALGNFGTKITVRNLFGNIPVRLRQRAKFRESDYASRWWEKMKLNFVALLLAWGESVTLALRDSRFGYKLIIRGNDIAQTRNEAIRRQSSGLSRVLDVLTHSSLIDPDGWAFWEPLCGSNSLFSIKGAISSVAAPSKHCQFICLGIEPILANTLYCVLFDEVNRVFSDSTFGAVEAEKDLEDTAMSQENYRARVKLVSAEGSRPKGVDRWPKFFLRLTPNSGKEDLGRTRDHLLDEGPRLKAMTRLLVEVAKQWLAERQFWPRNRRPVTKEEEAASKTTDMDEFASVNLNDSTKASDANRDSCSASIAQFTLSIKQEKERTFLDNSTAALFQNSRSLSNQDFSGWSKIKSARSRFYNEVYTRNEFLRNSLFEQGCGGKRTAQKAIEAGSTAVEHVVCSESCGSGPPASDRTPELTDIDESISDTDKEGSIKSQQDGFIEWKHPLTQEVFLVNKRSGIVQPICAQQTPLLRKSAHDGMRPLQCQLKPVLGPMSLSCRVNEVSESNLSNSWFENLLRDWNNPVFKPTKSCIEKVSTEPVEKSSRGRSRDSRNHLNGPPSRFMACKSDVYKLSSAGLKEATVIAQIEEKFILVKLPIPVTNTCDHRKPELESELLVVIDQHAADERCIVEKLFEEICKPAKGSARPGAASNLGFSSYTATCILRNTIIFEVPPKEAELIKHAAAYFARWGILYNISERANSRLSNSIDLTAVEIITLPHSISERCIAEPKLVIDLLRSEVWNYYDGNGSRRLPPPDKEDKDASDREREGSHSWLRQMSYCPAKLIDMLNSRACRNAIMFNDALRLDECRSLIERLSTCAFPFQCAHGRPTIVPLMDLGSTHAANSSLSTSQAALDCAALLEVETRQDDFRYAYTQWKKSWK